MMCQDCNKKTGDTLIFSIKTNDFFLVCRDCITNETDFICSDVLLKGWAEQ